LSGPRIFICRPHKSHNHVLITNFLCLKYSWPLPMNSFFILFLGHTASKTHKNKDFCWKKKNKRKITIPLQISQRTQNLWGSTESSGRCFRSTPLIAMVIGTNFASLRADFHVGWVEGSRRQEMRSQQPPILHPFRWNEKYTLEFCLF